MATIRTPRRSVRTLIKLGLGFTFNTRTGCLQHPGGHLTSWFRQNGISGKWSAEEWAVYLNPELSGRILEALNNPDTYSGKSRLPLRR